MAIGPISAGASRLAVKIAVGPSAPPMMPIDAALCGEKPSARAPRKVMKMPICAAAPSSRLFGFESSAAKSVIAPMPRKMSGGKMPERTPK